MEVGESLRNNITKKGGNTFSGNNSQTSVQISNNLSKQTQKDSKYRDSKRESKYTSSNKKKLSNLFLKNKFSSR